MVAIGKSCLQPYVLDSLGSHILWPMDITVIRSIVVSIHKSLSHKNAHGWNVLVSVKPDSRRINDCLLGLRCVQKSLIVIIMWGWFGAVMKVYRGDGSKFKPSLAWKGVFGDCRTCKIPRWFNGNHGCLHSITFARKWIAACDLNTFVQPHRVT